MNAEKRFVYVLKNQNGRYDQQLGIDISLDDHDPRTLFVRDVNPETSFDNAWFVLTGSIRATSAGVMRGIPCSHHVV